MHALLCLAIAISAPKSAPKKAETKAESHLFPLLRFYDEKLREHVYTYGTGEPAAWRKDKRFRSEYVVGIASTKPLGGTQRLYRAIRSDGRHYWYFQQPPALKGVRVEAFVIYVWKRPAADRVAIHASTHPEGWDLFLDSNRKAVDDYIKLSRNAAGIRRTFQRSVFYLQLPPKAKSTKK